MNNFLKRIDHITEAISASTSNKIELLYSDGTSKRFTECDAICEVFHTSEDSNPHIVGVNSDSESGVAGLLAALWK